MHESIVIYIHVKNLYVIHIHVKNLYVIYKCGETAKLNCLTEFHNFESRQQEENPLVPVPLGLAEKR